MKEPSRKGAYPGAPKLRFFVSVVLFIGLYLAHLLSDWWIVKISNIRMPGFVDLGYVFSGHNLCRIKANGASLWDLLFVVDCSDYVYGRALAGLSWQTSQLVDVMPYLNYIAVLLGTTLVAALAFLFARSSVTSFVSMIALSLLVFSPPILLLLERGNVDIVIALLVIIAAVGLAKRWWTIAILAIFISSLMKFYTLPLLWFLVFTLDSRKAKLWTLFVAIVSTTIVLQDVLRVSSGIPDGGYVQFGFPVWVHYFERFGIEDPFGIVTLLGILIPVSVAVLVANSNSFPVLESRFGPHSRSSLLEILGVLSSIVFLACYFVGLSFDYRLIFLLMAGVAYLRLRKVSSALSILLWALLGVALWGSTALGLGAALVYGGGWVMVVGLLQALGDLATMAWSGIILGTIAKSSAKLIQRGFGVIAGQSAKSK